MGAIASTDITITVGSRDKEIIGVMAGKNMTLATIAFGNAALTYPANGIPLPAIGHFGLLKVLDFMSIQPPPGDGFVYKYDSTNHTIRIYTQGFKTGATAAAENENGALVKNSLGVEGTPRIPNTVAGTTYDMGQMIEMPTGTAIPATSLKALVLGE
ncbi:MAG: hypothetical protein ABFD76_05170 [Smithella sp.]